MVEVCLVSERRETAGASGISEPLPETVTDDPRWQLTQRILASPQFRKANRLRDFLHYVVERTLQDRISEITEQQIGVHVFGRRPDYNASEDNVVRSQARLLRLKLESYFANDGAGEELTLSIPRGTYVPTFSRRGMEEPPEIVLGSSSTSRWKLPAAILALVVLAVAAGYWLAEPPRPTGIEWTRNYFWQKVFSNSANHGDGILVVPADASYEIAQEILRRRITLPEFLSKSYLPEWEAAARRLGVPRGLLARNLTAYDSTMNVSRIFRMGTRLGAGLKLRSARDVGYRDFRLASVILLGSARDNPWMEMVESRLPFQLTWDLSTNAPLMVNQSPLPGEQPAYRPEPTADGKDAFTHYAYIALLPNDARTGSVLVLGGTDASVVELAGDLLSDPSLFANVLVPRLRDASKTRTNPDLPYFQVLLQAREAEGRPLAAEIVAVRCWD